MNDIEKYRQFKTIVTNIEEYLQEVERELNGTYHVSNPKTLKQVVEDIQELLRR